MSSPNSEKVLKEVFGYSGFRACQKEIIENAIAGGHSLVVMPTGMGKSLCYQVPSRILEGVTLVISPLIALMKDQVDAAKKVGLKTCFINSSLSASERNNRYQGLAKGKYELVYVTPERFQKEEFRQALKQVSVKLLAIDEAHCISQWGHDFRPDYTRIGEFREFLGFPATMALTATATPEVRDDIIQQAGLTSEEVTSFVHGFHRKELQLGVDRVHGLENKLKLYERYRQRASGPMIVYFSLIQSLRNFSEQLSKKKIGHLVYHGKLGDRERRRAQDRFMASDNDVILATPAFGLGVNKSNVRAVIHAEVPGSVEAYYQEVGRAGRDGESALGRLFYDEDDITIQMEFIKWANPDPEFLRSVYKLVEQNAMRVNQEGIDYLRSQMNFYNSRDFRVETALNLLERWDFTEGELSQRNLAAVQPPSGKIMDKELFEMRLKGQHRKLLSIVQYAKHDKCFKHRIYEYFGVPEKGRCGNCDNCASLG